MKGFNLKSMIVLMAFVLLITLGGSIEVKAQEPDFKKITPFRIEKLSMMDDGIMDNADLVEGGTVKAAKDTMEETGDYFSFTLKEDSLVCLRFSMTETTSGGSTGQNALDSMFTVYANKSMTVTSVDKVKIDSTTSVDKNVYLKAGTYYIQVEGDYWQWRLEEDKENRIGIAVGYLPIKGKDTDFSVTLSKTETTTDDVQATVETADPDAAIYVQARSVSNNLVDNSYTWEEKYKLNSNKFVIKENGLYTIRIVTSTGKYEQKLINVTNIDHTKPTTPTVVTMKIGTKKITGKADAGTVVIAKIGSKTYQAVARDNDTYTITVPTLKKDTKISLYAKDVAGNKSDTKKVTAK